MINLFLTIIVYLLVMVPIDAVPLDHGLAQIKSELETVALTKVEATAEAAADMMVTIMNKVVKKAHEVTNSVELQDPSSPVKAAHATFLLFFSFFTIVMCCASTTICVRAARDSNITMNALSIRRGY